MICLETTVLESRNFLITFPKNKNHSVIELLQHKMREKRRWENVGVLSRRVVGWFWGKCMFHLPLFAFAAKLNLVWARAAHTRSAVYTLC